MSSTSAPTTTPPPRGSAADVLIWAATARRRAGTAAASQTENELRRNRHPGDLRGCELCQQHQWSPSASSEAPSAIVNTSSRRPGSGTSKSVTASMRSSTASVDGAVRSSSSFDRARAPASAPRVARGWRSRAPDRSFSALFSSLSGTAGEHPFVRPEQVDGSEHYTTGGDDGEDLKGGVASDQDQELAHKAIEHRAAPMDANVTNKNMPRVDRHHLGQPAEFGDLLGMPPLVDHADQKEQGAGGEPVVDVLDDRSLQTRPTSGRMCRAR